MKVLQINQQVKAVTPTCETCGDPHLYNDCPATVGQTQNVYAAGAYNQGGNSYQPQGTLPSNTITNPKEDLKGITTRSGIEYKGPVIPTTSSPPKVVECETEVTKDTVPPTNNGSTRDVQPSTFKALVSAPKPNPKPLIPYPSRLNDQKLRKKANDQMEKFFQIFQDLNFNISLADALILMPKFASTIKSLLTNKEKLFELARTPLNKHCSTVLLKKLLEKLRDPGKFLIPCDFSGMDECLALADLGASINLMPLFVWNKFSLPELSPTCITLEPAKRSISRPVGVVKDVFVKVGKFHFPANFVVVDFDADPRVLLILERSFLKIGRALIDVYEVELTLRVGNKAVTINLDQTSRYSANYDAESINRIDVIDVAYSDFLLEETDAFLAIEDEPISPEIDDSYYDSEGDILILEESIEDEPISPEIDDSYYDSEGDILILEEFLNDDPSSPPLPPQEHKGDDKLPVIIAKELKDEKKTALIKVLKSHKQALAWKLSNIKGINPEFYTHKILMEDDFKPAVQHQRKINPKIHEVIKKEVLNLLDAELIYPILDSPWSSGGVFTATKPLIFSRLATMDPPGDIMARTTSLKRCLIPVSIGPQSIMMPMTWSNLVKLVNVREKSRNVMKCLKMPSNFARSSTYEASISWGRSRLHEGTSFELPMLSLVIVVNGHRLKHYFGGDIPPMVVPDLQTFTKDN
nr:reverse transcriptase domain-containing protein [Tanacetum cinerariifolium]